MPLRVIGAGVGRTGTTSLQVALEMLLDGRCYHMHEVFPRPDDIPVWHDASLGKMPDWSTFLGDFRAAVDWPASAFWPELAEAFPDALIVFSHRDAESWWRSASNTIFPASLQAEDNAWRRMIYAMFEHRFTLDIENKDAAIAAYEAHNAAVRERAPAERLLEWQPGDGWKPLCAALDIPEPNVDFPHANTTDDFRKRVGKAEPEPGG